jgi:lambda family phage minor tail protein L
MTTIYEVSQRGAIPGGYVELYDLDATRIKNRSGNPGDVFHFTSMTYGATPLVWRGDTYTPIPVMVEGLSTTITGSQPRPTFTVSNVAGILMSALIEFGDLVGAQVRVWRTFSIYLDGEPEADASQHFPLEIYMIEEKTIHNDETIQWQLCNPLDRPNLKMPRRVVLRDTVNNQPGFPGVGRVKFIN